MSASDLHFTAEQEPQVENYRPLSGLAVVSLVLGLLSSLAVFGAYLVFLPLAAAAVSIAALWRIRASGGELSGRRLAVAALALACLFAAWTLSQDLGRRWILARQAKRFCDDWLAMVAEGDILEAYQWALEPVSRVPPDISLKAFYERNAEATERRDHFLGGLPFPTEDQKQSPLRKFRYLGNDSVTTQELGDDLVVHRYELIHEAKGELRRDVVLITVRRLPPGQSQFVHWHVREVRKETLPVLTF